MFVDVKGNSVEMVSSLEAFKTGESISPCLEHALLRELFNGDMQEAVEVLMPSLPAKFATEEAISNLLGNPANGQKEIVLGLLLIAHIRAKTVERNMANAKIPLIPLDEYFTMVSLLRMIDMALSGVRPPTKEESEVLDKLIDEMEANEVH